MPLSNTTLNWMKAPYPMDMDALKDVAKKEAAAIIDGLRDDAEVYVFINMMLHIECSILRDRNLRKRTIEELVESEGYFIKRLASK